MDQPSASEADAWRPKVGLSIHLQSSKHQPINVPVYILFYQKTGRQGPAADQEGL